VHFNHAGFLSRNFDIVGEFWWKKTVWPLSVQMRQLGVEEVDLPLPDEKGCVLAWKQEGGLERGLL
jgi:hypothetical protein